MRCNFKPVVADEEEIVRALHQPAEVSVRDGVPSKNVAEYLGREESRHVQQGVPSALESDYCPLVFFDLLFQRSYGIDADFPDHCCSWKRVRSYGMPRGSVYSHWWRCQITIVEVENSMLVTWTNEVLKSAADHSMLPLSSNPRYAMFCSCSPATAITLEEIHCQICLCYCAPTVIKSWRRETSGSADDAGEICPFSLHPIWFYRSLRIIMCCVRGRFYCSLEFSPGGRHILIYRRGST